MNEKEYRAEAIRERDEATSRFYEDMTKNMKRSAADRTFFESARLAKTSVITDGLDPAYIDFEWKYSPEQGAKAACLAREDIAAIVGIQYGVLKRLDRNRNYMWVIIALLLYIASQFK